MTVSYTRMLDAFTRHTNLGNTHICKMQDLAHSIDDHELKRRMLLCRDALEAADRRALDLMMDLPMIANKHAHK